MKTLGTAAIEDAEKRFAEFMREPLLQAQGIGEADIVVGIPFSEDADGVGSVVETVTEGLEKFFPNQKRVIVAVGSPTGHEALNAVHTIPESGTIPRMAFLLDDERLVNKDWSLRAIVAVTRVLGAHLVILEGGLKSRTRNGDIEGLAPDWVSRLLEPITSWDMDLVVPRFNHHYFECPLSTHLVTPLATAIYNRPIHDLPSGQWGVSYSLLRTYPRNARLPKDIDKGGQSVEDWLIAAALSGKARTCEANLGVKLYSPSATETALLVRQVAGVMFDLIAADSEVWRGRHKVGEMGPTQPISSFGPRKNHQPDPAQISAASLVTNYQRGFNRFHLLYKKVMSGDTYQQLQGLAETEPGQFHFPSQLYVRTVYHLLLAYAFSKESVRGDLRDSFIPLFEGCVSSFAQRLNAFKARVESALPGEAERLTSLEAWQEIEEVTDEFIQQRPEFLAAWEKSYEAALPPVPKVTYREFIPGVPLIVPLELAGPKGNLVTANGIYDSLFRRYRQQFEKFVYGRLKVDANASSGETGRQVEGFMRRVEEQLGVALLPGDVHSVEGTRSVVSEIFRSLPQSPGLALSPEMTSWLLRRHPPSYLLTRLGYHNLNELLLEQEPNDVLALAGWSEGREYRQQLWASIRGELRPEHFEVCKLSPLVVKHEEYPSLIETRESSALDKMTGRVVVSTLPKDMGGQFPKLRYLTTIGKNIIEAETFGRVWRRFAEEEKDFGDSVINSLVGHWGRAPLSAHNIFENGHQRVLVERLRVIARQIFLEAGEDPPRQALVALLNDVIDSYHLAFTLPDGGFVPCSAWTWASYSFSGGTGVPTPLSLFVERDWYSHEFLTEYYRAIGGTGESIDDKIIELMGQGRESEDLVPILLGPVEQAEDFVPRPTVNSQQPQAGSLLRFPHNPVLTAIKEHPWESKYILNPGAIRIDGKVYLVYRAVGEDGISRLGLAASEDGFNFSERLAEPIFEPQGTSEKRGCEDPRLTRIGERIYMAYIAYDGFIAQIALASITIDDFISYRWKAWRRHGLVFPGFTDKNGALFPEQSDGKFAMLHRVDPHIWITFSSHLRCPWPRKEHRILAGSGSGMMWDGNKVGTGAPPLKTKHGWLLITHGVDHRHVYRLGVMLLDLADPTIVLYRSPNPILEPVEPCEAGQAGQCWIHNVVYACGAVPREGNKEILDADDEILVYYGAADTAVCVASARIGDLIPVGEQNLVPRG